MVRHPHPVIVQLVSLIYPLICCAIVKVNSKNSYDNEFFVYRSIIFVMKWSRHNLTKYVESSSFLNRWTEAVLLDY